MEEAAGRLSLRGKLEYPSQEAFLLAVRRELRALDAGSRIGARRLRRVLLDAGRLRLRIAYSERVDRRPLPWCPVCVDALRPVVNQTLEGDRVTLGYRCRRCGYWTHLNRRVPIRYSVRILPGRGPATVPASG